MSALASAVKDFGGSIQRRDGDRYLYVTFADALSGTDDVEFLFAANDATVALRSAARRGALPDLGRNAARLEGIRVALGWEQVCCLPAVDEICSFMQRL